MATQTISNPASFTNIIIIFVLNISTHIYGVSKQVAL